MSYLLKKFISILSKEDRSLYENTKTKLDKNPNKDLEEEDLDPYDQIPAT